MNKKQKHRIITKLLSSFIGLAYEGISSFLHTNATKHYTKQSKLWIVKPLSNATN